MHNPYENESELQNMFWLDVYSYMEEHSCDKETAIKTIEPLYPELT